MMDVGTPMNDMQRHRTLASAVTCDDRTAVVVVDRQGFVTLATAGVQPLLGWRDADLLGQDMHALLHPHCASGSNSHVDGCVWARLARSDGTIHGGDDVVVCNDGRTLPVAYLASPLVEADHVVGMVVTLYDLSERTRTVNELALLQSLALELHSAEDVGAALLQVLRAICEATGWMVGQAWLPCTDGAILACSSAWYARARV